MGALFTGDCTKGNGKANNLRFSSSSSSSPCSLPGNGLVFSNDKSCPACCCGLLYPCAGNEEPLIAVAISLLRSKSTFLAPLKLVGDSELVVITRPQDPQKFALVGNTFPQYGQLCIILSRIWIIDQIIACNLN